MKFFLSIVFYLFFFTNPIFAKEVDNLIGKNVQFTFSNGTVCSFSLHKNGEVTSDCITEGPIKYEIIESNDLRYIIFGPSTNKKGFSNTNAILYDVEDKVTLKFGILPNEENAKWMTVAPEVEISEIIKNEIISDEIVINKKGQSVLLKSNGTWEILSNEGDEGKVVFLIKQATDSHKSYDRKNDLDEFTHYSNYVGCVYNIEVINKTDHKIKINRFSIQTNNKKLFSDRMTRKSMIQYGKIIEPGESYVGKGDMREGGPRQKVDDTKEIATEDQIKKWKSKYGCEAQKGSIFITTPDLGMGPDIAFSDESGITNETKNNFIIGSDKGVYPLLKDIKLH